MTDVLEQLVTRRSETIENRPRPILCQATGDWQGKQLEIVTSSLKETDRRWEHGEDLSVLDSRMAEISLTKVVADAALKAKMSACGVRALMRKTGLSQHTIEKVVRGLPVRRTTLQRVITALRTINR